MIHRIRPRAAASLLLVLAACASSPEGDSWEGRSVAWLVAHGKYDAAVEKAASASEARPDDAEAAEVYRLASTAWLLEHGRRLYFEGHEEDALVAFYEAREIAPESEAARGWILSTKEKLADLWFGRGLEHHVATRLDEAVKAYEMALSYRPDHTKVRETLARVLVQQNHRQGMGEDYYDDGIVALDRYFLHEASSKFAYVLKYEPDNERAERREEDAQDMLASERVAIASAMEADGQFSASRNEYRLALLLDEDLAVAKEGLERMKVEEVAAELLREAGRLILKERYSDAEVEVAAALEITKRQQQDCETLTAAIAEARLERRYVAARTLESDMRYADAVAAYQELLDLAPFYRDAIARKDTLESYVRDAHELYARYEAATTDEDRLDSLLQIAVFWPEYLDVEKRLFELQDALGEPPH